MQAGVHRHDGFQCGYCTPGQIMSATAMLHEPCGPGDDDVREAMSGNICRAARIPASSRRFRMREDGAEGDAERGMNPFDYTAARDLDGARARQAATRERGSSPAARHSSIS